MNPMLLQLGWTQEEGYAMTTCFAVIAVLTCIAICMVKANEIKCPIHEIKCEAIYPEAPFNDDLIVYECPKCGLKFDSKGERYKRRTQSKTKRLAAILAGKAWVED